MDEGRVKMVKHRRVNAMSRGRRRPAPPLWAVDDAFTAVGGDRGWDIRANLAQSRRSDQQWRLFSIPMG